MKGNSFSPQYSRTKTRKLMSNFSDNPLLIKTLQLNRLSNTNILKNSTYQTIKKSLKKFDKDSLKAQGQYNQLKLENNFYSSQFRASKKLNNCYKSLSNSKEKKNNDIFEDIKEKYVKMGYKIPDLSVKKNLFKIELLLEESESKIKEGFLLYPNSQKKNFDYLEKLINLVDQSLNKKEEAPNSDNDQFLYTSTGFKSIKNLSQISKNVSKPSLTISNETCQNGQKNNIEIENFKLLEQIKILIQLINLFESNSLQRTKTDETENIKKVTISPPKNKLNLQILENHKKLQENMSLLSNQKSPSSMSAKSIFNSGNLKKVKRGSVLSKLNIKRGINDKPPIISKEIEAMIKYKNFKNDFEFLEFAYRKIQQNEYELVFEMLKIFLKQTHHYDDEEINKIINCKRNINTVTLLKDFSTLSLKLKSNNIHNKIERIYENSSNFLFVLPNLKKVDLVNRKLGQMDKEFIKNMTNNE